jgi:hypothetical protein
VAFNLFGEVYVTEDAGMSWRKIAREFAEILVARLGLSWSSPIKRATMVLLAAVV